MLCSFSPLVLLSVVLSFRFTFSFGKRIIQSLILGWYSVVYSVISNQGLISHVNVVDTNILLSASTLSFLIIEIICRDFFVKRCSVHCIAFGDDRQDFGQYISYQFFCLFFASMFCFIVFNIMNRLWQDFNCSTGNWWINGCDYDTTIPDKCS